MESDKITITYTPEQLEALHKGPRQDEQLIQEGEAFIEREKELTQSKSLAIYWKGAFFSIALSFALVMEGRSAFFTIISLTLVGYDCIMGSFFGQPSFQRYFGTQQPDGEYLINANWQTAIGNTQTAVNLLGLLITGLCQEKYGSKKTYIGGMILITAVIFVAVFANSIGMFLAAEALIALPWGMFRALS